jgi:hypothetical protein
MPEPAEVPQCLGHREPQAVLGRLVTPDEREVEQPLECVERHERRSLRRILRDDLDRIQRRRAGKRAEPAKKHSLFDGQA